MKENILDEGASVFGKTMKLTKLLTQSNPIQIFLARNWTQSNPTQSNPIHG